MNPILNDLRSLVQTVSDDPLDLMASSRDLWPRDTLGLSLGRQPHLPAAVCWPRSPQEVDAVLGWATRTGTPIVPYGAGSGVCGGARGQAGSVVLDTKRLDHLSPVDPSTHLATFGPGLLGQVLEDRLEAQGFATRHSPSSIWCSTPGGWAAARSAGQFSSFYGKFEDMVMGLEVHTPAGLVRTGIHTPPGEEDLGPLVQGSEGTLGIITEITARVVPLPRGRWLRGYVFPSMEPALEAMRAILQAELWPSVVRLYDPADTLVGGRVGRGHDGHGASRKEKEHPRIRRILERIEERGLHRKALPTLLASPRLLNRAVEGAARKVVLILGWEGEPEIFGPQVDAARRLLAGAVDLGSEVGERWYAHRHDVSYKASPVFCHGGFADTMEVAATWSRLEDLYHGVRQALSHHAMVMAHFSHAYPEGCSIYFSFAGPGDLDRYDRAWNDALDAVRQAGGTVTHHHGVGLLKAEAATREAGHAVRVYFSRKGRLDPGGVLNPGRVFLSRPVEGQGPPAPTGGPVFRVDERSLVAAVDPHAPPEILLQALARHGLRPRILPDRPLARWFADYRCEAFDRHEVPLFSVQARFSDGCSAKAGLAPRSAAGPDLRWGLLRDGRPELVEIPVVPEPGARQSAVRVEGPDPWSQVQASLRAGLRPLDTTVTREGVVLHLVGGASEDHARVLERSGARQVPIPPGTGRAPDLRSHVEPGSPQETGTPAHVTSHHRLYPPHR